MTRTRKTGATAGGPSARTGRELTAYGYTAEVSDASETEALRKKNLRLHQSKID